MLQTTSGTAGNGLFTTTKYMRGAAGIGLGNAEILCRRRKPTADICVYNIA
jgi:hypothetical protein